MNTKLEDAINALPEHCRACVTNYVAHGQRPSGFIEAVLCTPLPEFAEDSQIQFTQLARSLAGPEQADQWDNWRALLFAMPYLSWGSRVLVNRWIARGGMTGRKEVAA